MTQLDLLTAVVEPATIVERMAAFFRERPGQPVDMHVLDQRFGCGGWRTRVSDLRRAPWFMAIENRWWEERRADGTKYRVSVYTYRPAGERAA